MSVPMPVAVRVCLTFIVLTTIAAAGTAQQTGDSALVAWVRGATIQRIVTEGSSPIVLDLVEADVPALTALLTTGNEDQRLFAAKALGYGGGDAAIAALRANPDAARSVGAMLVTALALRGLPSDVAELLGHVDGSRQRHADTAVVLTLGAQRVAAALPALERLARGRDGGGPEIRHALASIQRGHADVSALPAVTDDEQVIAAVLRAGLPFAGNGAIFDDDTRGGTWILEGDAWRFRAGGRGGGRQSLTFTTGFSRSRERAVVSVAHICGSLCGTGYDFLLTRGANGWTVRAVRHTWEA